VRFGMVRVPVEQASRKKPPSDIDHPGDAMRNI
jgi:hypothetical protein